MPLAPVDVLPSQGGFVAAAELMPEVLGAEAAPAADVVPVADVVAAAAAPAAVAGTMRWNNKTSRFVLRRMA